MKPLRHLSVAASAPCAAVFTLLTFTAQAQIQWSLPGTGSYLTGGNWTGGNVPGPTDDAAINLSGAVVQIGGTDVVANDTFSVANGRLEMSGGTLTSVDRLTVTAAGGTAAISGGTANVRAFQVTGGAGIISGGMVNAPVDVRALSNGSITVSGGTLVAGKVVATGNITATGNAVVTMEQGTGFSAGNANELWIGTTGGVTVTASGSAIWTHRSTSAASSVSVGRGSIGTLHIRDDASFTSMGYSGPLGEFTAKVIQVGNNANGSNGNGTVQVDGGTITAIGYNRGSLGVINANGGTFRAVGASANYFANFTGTGGDASVNLQSGGMKFDTNNSDVTISNVLSGTGGLTKLGAGVLTLSGGNTYTGETKVSNGELLFQSPVLENNSSVVVEDGGVLNLAHGSRDVIGSLTIGTTVHSSGSWGSSASAAQNKDDVHFKGSGMVYVGTPPPPRNLLWTGAASQNWSANGDLNFTVAGTPTFFETSDHVTFSLTSPPVATIHLTGSIDAGTLTFGGTSGYTLLAPATGIGGGASIVMDSPGVLTLGGATSTFTGPVQVNAGTIVMADNKSFGATSGITIANGGQVDVNGREPGAIYSYTIGGVGPDNEGQIINSGAGRFGNAGVKHLTLTADARIGGSGRFDIGEGGLITGNGYTLTKVGTADMAFRGNASGSPIHYVIAAGRAWAENSNDSLGGAGGSVTVQGGASIGSYGVRTLATPLTLQSGATLNNLGAGKGTWTASVSITGQATIDAGGGAIDVTGPVSGPGSLVKTGANDVALSSSAGGNATVLEGTLRMAGYPSSAADVVIAEGAVLELTSTETSGEVKSLTLGSTIAPAGTEWGSPESGAQNVSGLLKGPGRVFVAGEPPAAPGYFQWAVGKGLTGYAALPQSDGDGDGVANSIEFVVDSNPASAVIEKLPQATITPTHFEFVFRSRSSLQGYVPVVEYGTGLSNWTTATDGQPAENPVEIDTEPNGSGSGVDKVTVRIPRALAPEAKLFARLRVTGP